MHSNGVIFRVVER